MVFMTQRSPWWLAAVIIALAGIEAPSSPPSDDREVSVGRWDFVAVEANGKPVDAEVLKLLQVTYGADGSWAVLFKGRPVGEGTSRNDQAASPKTFEMETLGGRKTKPRRYTGIYKQDGDVRQFCFVSAGRPRPDEFAAPRGSGRILVTLKRAEEPGVRRPPSAREEHTRQ
jgi:uncharacterized protein (TIGR03067 family)